MPRKRGARVRLSTGAAPLTPWTGELGILPSRSNLCPRDRDDQDDTWLPGAGPTPEQRLCVLLHERGPLLNRPATPNGVERFLKETANLWCFVASEHVLVPHEDIDAEGLLWGEYCYSFDIDIDRVNLLFDSPRNRCLILYIQEDTYFSIPGSLMTDFLRTFPPEFRGIVELSRNGEVRISPIFLNSSGEHRRAPAVLNISRFRNKSPSEALKDCGHPGERASPGMFPPGGLKHAAREPKPSADAAVAKYCRHICGYIGLRFAPELYWQQDIVQAVLFTRRADYLNAFPQIINNTLKATCLEEQYRTALRSCPIETQRELDTYLGH